LVELYQEDVTGQFVLVDSMRTKDGGAYKFDSLLDGNYKVRFILPEEWISYNPITPQDVPSATDSLDSDADRETWFTDVYTIDTSLPEDHIGRNNPTVDGGVDPYGSVSNFVWKDDNNNGIQDSEESGLGNVKIQIFEASDLNNPLFETYTDSTGNYSFDSLLTGDYIIFVEAPLGRTFTTKGAGTDDAMDSDINPSGFSDTIEIVLTLDFTDPRRYNDGVDAEFAGCGTLGDLVWKDTNGNGIQDLGENGVQGVKVRLWKLENGVPLEIIDSTETNNLGFYEFTDLLKGDYVVELDINTFPSDCQLSAKKDQAPNDEIDNDFDEYGFSSAINISPENGGLQQVNMTIDAALISIENCPPQNCIPIGIKKVQK
jgi:large repetitive protein